MKSQKEIWENILNFNGNLTLLEKELKEFPFDSDEEIVTLCILDLIYVLKKWLELKLPMSFLIKWANLIECRDQIGFENDIVQEIVSLIANAEINNIHFKSDIEEIILFLKESKEGNACKITNN